MRAKVAKNAGGHALEKRFLDLSDIELSLLYMQAIKEENDTKKEHFEWVKVLNESWTKKIENQFELLRLFVDPKIFKHVQEMKELKEHETEVSVDNFNDEWEKLMAIIPEQYVVDESESVEVLSTDDDPELDEMMAGWIKNKKRFVKE